MSARVLVYDVEVSPIVAYTWSLKPDFIPIDFIVENPRLLCIGYQWLGERKVGLLSEWEHGRAGMLEGIHRLFSEADVVSGFNSRSFDTPWVLAELARDGFPPPSPSTQVDLYREARQFRLPSHKLQYISTEIFHLSGKLSTGGMSLWRDVLAGDEKAQARMGRYCKQDVRLTAELYQQMLPWLKTAPNRSLYVSDDVEVDEFDCPKCEANQGLVKRGFKYTRLGKFQAYQCTGCGGWSQGRKNLRTVGTRGAA